jgi:hypothetical protein
MGVCRILGLALVAIVLSGCGVLGGGGAAATPTTGAPPTGLPATSAPSPAAAAAKPAASAIPSAGAKPTGAPAAPAAQATTVWVGNTDGEGVYVRNTPLMTDRAKAYPDGTALTVVGDDVDADGQHWKHIKTPDGLEGYVPSIYTVETPP